MHVPESLSLSSDDQVFYELLNLLLRSHHQFLAAKLLWFVPLQMFPCIGLNSVYPTNLGPIKSRNCKIYVSQSKHKSLITLYMITSFTVYCCNRSRLHFITSSSTVPFCKLLSIWSNNNVKIYIVSIAKSHTYT